MNTLKDISISKDKTILDAYKQMDNLDSKLLIVVDNEKFLSLISAGDIQRAIIQNKPLSTSIKDNLRLNIKIATEKDSYDEIKNMMITFRMEFCPVIDHENSIKKVYFWKDIFKEKATIAFNVSDVFNSRKRIFEANIPNFINSYSEVQWRVRQFTLSLTYRFNRAKNEKERQPRRDNEGGGEIMG